MCETLKRVAIAITLTGAVAMTSQAAKPIVPASSKPSSVLVELFTSEGCSSCPPADELLKQINGTRTSAGQLIVGISEHVTYWNSLGWFDPFSSSIFTDRQNMYGSKFHLDSAYTPQMVVNGTEQFVGSDRNALARAIQKQQERPAVTSLHILSTNIAGNTLTVSFSAAGDASSQSADIVAVLADDADSSNVLHGENSGHTLSHVAVARSMTRVAKVQTTAEQTVKIPVPPSFRASTGHHIILFAQAPGSGAILGVDTKTL